MVHADRMTSVHSECKQSLGIPQCEPTGCERAPVMANDNLGTTEDIQRGSRDDWY